MRSKQQIIMKTFLFTVCLLANLTVFADNPPYYRSEPCNANGQNGMTQYNPGKSNTVTNTTTYQNSGQNNHNAGVGGSFGTTILKMTGNYEYQRKGETSGSTTENTTTKYDPVREECVTEDGKVNFPFKRGHLENK